MDLVRVVAGDWKRTDDPYQCVEIDLAGFLCFAYASERACLVAGETKSAEIWRFVRSIGRDASKAQRGYLQKGGVSRILLSARTLGVGPVHCVREMLAFDSPLDTLAFARSELWPVEKGAGVDGWSQINAQVVALRPMNAAWRGTKITGKQVVGGLLGAGVELSGRKRWNAKNANLRGATLRGADLYASNLSDAKLTGADLSGADMKYARLKGADLRDAILTGANLTGANLRGANLTAAYLHRANLTGADLHEADLTHAILTGAKNVNLEGAMR